MHIASVDVANLSPSSYGIIVYEMIDDIQIWRENAKKNNIPFFVFTILREPIDAYISTFNYFCIYSMKRGDLDCPLPHDFDHMWAISRDNTQSRYLCYATVLNLVGSRREATEDKSIEEGCGDIVKLVEENMDWVGIMSEFKDTLGIFLSMGIDLGFYHKNKAQGFEKINKRNFNETQTEMVNSRLSEDRRLVDWARKTYTLPNFGVDPRIVDGIEKFAVKWARKEKEQQEMLSEGKVS